MTLNECTTDENAITAALVQGLHQFIHNESKPKASDIQLEAAAYPFHAPTGGALGSPCRPTEAAICR